MLLRREPFHRSPPHILNALIGAPSGAPSDSRGMKLRTITNALTGRLSNRLAVTVSGLILSLLVTLLGVALPATSADIETAVDEKTAGNAKSVESQKRVDKLDDETDEMAANYRSALDQIASLRIYNAQLDKLLAAQNVELDSLGQQIANVTVIGREVTPLMLRMLDRLDAFVQADVPLLLSERRERVANLRSLMNRADVADSEKYRRITEAYQIENEYGRTIETYQGTLDINGQERTLEFLRVGRVALVYQTLDGSEIGAWDQQQREWGELPDQFRDSIRKGIRIARKQLAPDMIRMPVSAPEDARQ